MIAPAGANRDKEDRAPPRVRILAAAAELFYRHGIRAVGVEAIAEAADTNKMTLYRHFASKDELVAEYLRQSAGAADACWERFALAHPGDPLAQLSAWLEEMARHLAEPDERGCALANAAIELPEKDHPARRVIEEYKRAMEMSPENPISAKGVAALLFNMKRLEESKEYHRKVIDVDPSDPESYYAIAVIDWTQAYTARNEAANKLGLDMSTPLIDKNECWTLRNENEDRVKEGIEMLTKALELRTDYDDAMAYLNLLYRQRADIHCGDKAAYNRDIVVADKWVDRAMATKKARAEKERPVPQNTEPN